MRTTNKTLLNSKLADRTFLVGGAVRDFHLNLPVEDMDYVVTASQEEFVKHFPDAKMVGNSFPVYLIEGEEVALSRTERSTGVGYGNFELTGVGVSIEEDLARRDFTINAMAMNIVTGELVDPFFGLKDLENGLIRTTYKDSFKDDPVRILRAFRFAARYDFEMNLETENQIKSFKGELQYVTKERIVLELTKVWKQAKHPSNYFGELLRLETIDLILEGFSKLNTVPAGPTEHHSNLTAFEHTMEVIDRVKELDGNFHQGMAALFHDIGKAFTDEEILPHHFGHEDESEKFSVDFFENHKFSKRVNEFVPKVSKFHMKAHAVEEMSARKLAKLTLDLGRRDFDEMLLVFDADHKLNEKTKKRFDFMRELLFNTDFSELKDVPPKQRAQRAHQLRVSKFKQFFKGEK